MQQILPSIHSVAGDAYVFQQDSAPAHCARQTDELLQCETSKFTTPVLWPANSPGVLFTIGRTTVVHLTPVVRHPCYLTGYSRNMSHVQQSHDGRKFGRRSPTNKDMSYDLTKFDVIARILAVYCNLANYTCIC